MKLTGKWIAVVVLLLGVQASATILPPNNLHLFDNVNATSNITEEQFNKITDSIVAMYQPLAALHGAKLVAVKKWTDPTVNAYAEQSGNTWTITMFGGLARREEITVDGFAMVVCHELGHHFGGYYFYGDREWAASEGESDYFATQACGRKVFANSFKKNSLFDSPNIPAVVKEKCDKTWRTPNDQNLCYRLSNAGFSLAHLLAKLGGGGVPKFETPDKSKVSRTNTAHPAAQCRLDTYFAGAVCGVSLDEKVIPGKNNPKGQNSKDSEAIAAQYSCFASKGIEDGTRPLCWFAPQL